MSKTNKNPDGNGKEKNKIKELSEEEVGQYVLLGKAIGVNMGHCLYLGVKHKERFWDRVCGYRIIQNDKTAKVMAEAVERANGKVEKYISINFY